MSVRKPVSSVNTAAPAPRRPEARAAGVQGSPTYFRLGGASRVSSEKKSVTTLMEPSVCSGEEPSVGRRGVAAKEDIAEPAAKELTGGSAASRLLPRSAIENHPRSPLTVYPPAYRLTVFPSLVPCTVSNPKSRTVTPVAVPWPSRVNSYSNPDSAPTNALADTASSSSPSG